MPYWTNEKFNQSKQNWSGHQALANILKGTIRASMCIFHIKMIYRLSIYSPSFVYNVNWICVTSSLKSKVSLKKIGLIICLTIIIIALRIFSPLCYATTSSVFDLSCMEQKGNVVRKGQIKSSIRIKFGVSYWYLHNLVYSQ